MIDRDISVVLGSFNGEQYIRRQLTSIIEQDLPPAEIVVNDDCSTDRTLEIVGEVAASTSIPVHVARNAERVGFADNFLTACERASAPFIAFSDQDDDWYPDKLSAQRAALDAHRAVLASHPVDYVDGRGAALPPPDRAALQDRLRGRPTVLEPLAGAPWGNYLGFTMLFASSLLNRIPSVRRGLDPHSPGLGLSHDRWVYFLASVFGRTVVLPRVLARYRQHDRQLFGGTKHRSVGERVRGKLLNGREQGRYLQDVAEYRADLLTEYEAHTAASVWRGRALQLGSRTALHDQDSVVDRLRTVNRRLRDGAYLGPAEGGVGNIGLAEDIVVALGRSFVSGSRG